MSGLRAVPTPSKRTRRVRRNGSLVLLCVRVMSCVAVASTPVASKPYDAELQRLSEILGALHYLRQLCGNDDGQTWRRHMQALIAAEGSSPLRRALLARRFNQGYRNYSRTYKSCTVTAKSAMNRFVSDAQTVAQTLVDTAPSAENP